MKNFPLVAAVLPLTCLMLAAQEADLGQRIYSSNAQSVLLLYVQANGEYVAQGSGFLIDNSRIVTNAHVANGGKVFVELGPARIPAKLEKVDTQNDLAILSVDVEMTSKPLQLAEKKPSPGDLIFAITNPEGLERTISQGVVSANREISGRRLLQISTPISHGSSGGPIFNRNGQVIGIAVGTLAEGQNLNFAVPVELLRTLLARSLDSSTELRALLDQVTSLQSEQAQEQYSDDEESGYQKKQRQIRSLLAQGVVVAGDNPETLFKIARLAQGSDLDIAVTTAQRSVDARPSPESCLLLADVLINKSFLSQGDDRSKFMERSEAAARAAIKLSRAPSVEMFYRLGDTLEDEGKYEEAEKVLRNVLTRADKASDVYFGAVRNMILCGVGLNRPDEEKYWFSELEKTGQATSYDWHSHAGRLNAARQYKEAAAAYSHAATDIKRDWCSAADAYDLASDPDSSLAANRKCIDAISGTKDSEKDLAWAHISIAVNLNQRGVYAEALSHAKEAATLDSSNAFGFDAEADALNHLQRFNEAINASKEALRLSDGKYASMHFTMGTAYFGTENWTLAKQSFEKAAELDPKDDMAAYNVAICSVRLGYYNDAAHWYEEVLRRNPNRQDKDELRQRIDVLRR